jgi:hypothetical protein
MDSPADAKGYLERGKTRATGQDLEGALADFTEALRLDPANVEAYMCRAQVRHRLGDVLDAMNDYGEASKIDLERARALAPPGVEFGDMPNVINLNVNPATAPQGLQPALTTTAVLSALVWVVLAAAAAGGAGWLMSAGALERSWTGWSWVGYLVAWGALAATFALCFGFGVVFNYINGGLGSTVQFAQIGAVLGLVLGGIACGLYSASPFWLAILAANIGWFFLLGVLGMIVARYYRSRAGLQSPAEAFPPPPPGTVPRGVFLIVWGLAIVGGIAIGVLVSRGWIPADPLKGALVGLVIAIPLAFYAGGLVAILLESTGQLRFAVACACLLAGAAGGALAGMSQLDQLFELILAGTRGGVFGALAGMLAAVVVGLIGARFFPGRSHPESFCGAMGAALRLAPGHDPGAASQLATLVGIYPGAAVGLWCGTVLGVLGYLGEDREGPGAWFVAAPVAGALLAVVFFGTRVVLQGAGTPRSGRGMLGVMLAGAAVGAVVAGVAVALAIPVGGAAYWIAGMAGTGALVGVKCWEFLGGDVVSPPLFPF